MGATLEREILPHYLDRFRRKQLRTGDRSRRVGLEAKFCLTDSAGEAVAGEQLQYLFTHLETLGWKPVVDAHLGVFTGATIEWDGIPAVISTGTGHCKVEFAVPHAADLHTLESNFRRMVDDARVYTGPNGVHLLCLGVHPVTSPGPQLVQRKARHLFWDRVFTSGLVHLFALSADCQVHVDVSPSEAHMAVNVLQGFTGAQIALTANATVWNGIVDGEHLDVREAFWDWWLPEEDRVGVARKPFRSINDYVGRVASMRPVMVEREGVTLGIYEYPTFAGYYGGGKATAQTVGGEEIAVVPDVNDIDLHDTFNWFSARLSKYCTVENRANCQQPPDDIMAIPALTLGLVENLEESQSFLREYDWDMLRDFRLEAIKVGPRAEVDGLDVALICRGMLQMAKRGLASRGMGEERYLEPLWERLEERTCPALECRELFESGGTEALIERYSL